MGVRALTIGQTKEYVSWNDPDKGTPKQTIFTIQALDVFVAADIADNATLFRDGGAQFASSTAALKRVRFGLKSIANFRDDSDKIVEFKTEEVEFGGRKYQVVSDVVLQRMPLDLIQELSTAIVEFNTVAVDEVKNSDAA